MKFGFRKPSLKKSLSARTRGRATRAVKGLVNPLYGKKGMGWIKNPKKALYNKIYRKTTVSFRNAGGCLMGLLLLPVYCLFGLLKKT